MSLSFYFTASNTLKAAVGVYYITHRLELQNIAFKIHAKLSSGKPKRIHHVRQVCPIFKQILRLSVCVCVCVCVWLFSVHVCLHIRFFDVCDCGFKLSVSLSLCLYPYLAFLYVCNLRRPRFNQGCSAQRMDGWLISVYCFLVCFCLYVLSFVVVSMCLYVVFCFRPCLYVESIFFCLGVSTCSFLSSVVYNKPTWCNSGSIVFINN